jgi:hypothetical protein
MSALFAFPAGYIIAALVGIAAILFVVRHSDTIDFKQPLGALLGFMIVWILPFSASLLVAQVAIGFAHTAFIVDLFSRGDQFWPPFWIWIGRFADLIAVFGLVFGLLKVLRRGRHRDQVVADLLIALLIYENIFREVRAQKQKRG